MKQPVFAPVLAGGGVVGGMAGIFVSGYALVDCFRYERGRGACTQVVEEHVLPLVTGIAAVSGTVGGLFTYNRRLERPEAPPAALATKEKLEPTPIGGGLDFSLRRSFKEAIAAGEVAPVGMLLPPPPPAVDLRREAYMEVFGAQTLPGDPWEAPPVEPVERIRALRAEGLSLQKIADQMDTTVYRVRQALEGDAGG
jgi:hypothetical protein